MVFTSKPSWDPHQLRGVQGGRRYVAAALLGDADGHAACGTFDLARCNELAPRGRVLDRGFAVRFQRGVIAAGIVLLTGE